MSDLADYSIVEAGAGLRSRAFSARELTEAALARQAATDGHLHAYVELTAESALRAADEADRSFRNGIDRGPLHGIPVAVKDIFDVAGVPTRCGSRVRENATPAAADAHSVAKVRAGGAVLLGKTVTQEFAAGVVSVPARNPWDPFRIPGGSSGGTGAAVAAGSAMAGFGSDTGGSIRNPASVNGVVGLKPTYGAVSKRGVFPLSWSLDTVGPLARRVEDATLFFDVIRGHDPADVSSSSHQGEPAANQIGQPIARFRIGVSRTFFLDRVTAAVEAAFEQALDVLGGLGAEIVESPWAEAGAARAASFVINRVETVGVHERGLREHPDLYAPEMRLRLEANSLYPALGYLDAQRARQAAKRSMAALFAEHHLDALIAPACPSVAAPADDLFVDYESGERESVHLAYTRLTMPFNATGQPVLAVPCGFDERGLPIGLQIAGRPFDEAGVCRIGHAYEQAAGWFTRRPPLAEQQS